MEYRDNPIGIEVVLMENNGKKDSVWLPLVPQGRYSFEDSNPAVRHNVYIEGYQNKWYVHCISPTVFLSDGEKTTVVELRDQHLFQVESMGFCGAIYTEWSNHDSQMFYNYVTRRVSEITIGRSTENDIVYSNGFVSRHHAVIRLYNGYWKITDLNSVNHVYVNGIRTTDQYLNIGDVIYIVGLKIIIGSGFIGINNGNKRVIITNQDMDQVTSTKRASDMHQPEGEIPQIFFNRLPRQRLAMIPKEIEIEGPPMSLNSHRIPLLLRMGSSMVLGGSAALMGHFTTLISSVLFPILTQKYTDKEKEEYEQRRVKSYSEYLYKMETKIEDEKKEEQRILNHNYPEFSYIMDYTDTKKQLWERRKSDDDFLKVRLGSGKSDFLGAISYPERKFDMDEDPLEVKMYELAERKILLENVPILTSLTQNFVCGITGDYRAKKSFMEMLLMQICILHSYDEVKTVILLDREDLKHMQYLQYLPHVWDDNRTIRFIATDCSEAYQIGEYLKNEIIEDLEKPQELKKIIKKHPYYVVFALSKRIFDSIEIFKEIMQLEKTCGVSIITMFDDLPKDCFQLFSLTSNGMCTLTHLKEIEREDEQFIPDEYDLGKFSHSAKVLANTNLKMITEAYSLPKMLTFLQMFGVGRVEHLNPVKKWNENDPVKSLSTPIGVATDGSLFTLDVHQKFEGPHGLIAGMTGSGKSEFILTYILSMAINYHPDEVAFILIDYKGGGLAGAFEDKSKGVRLPHLVGTITNLDGSAIQRSLISIQSELKRRQRVFSSVNNVGNEGTMDIYKYQKLYRQHKVSDPMPHLFIISDEFAELKQQEPEFMEQLISVARIGRSLGIHLILATQRPTGVVNDQILSNTKFRICLKVQDRSDSMDMLKRPEAVELKDTGRFYLQVGYNEHFALGQSAWCGAPYEPETQVSTQKLEEIQFLDTVGQTIHTVKQEKKVTKTNSTQLVEIVKMLSESAKKIGFQEKKLWKEPLSEQIDITSLRDSVVNNNEHGDIQVPIGMIDDPENQSQFVYDLDLLKMKDLLVIGDSSSGKSTFLQSVIFSLAQKYSPNQVQMYIVDYSNRSLCKFGSLPHCGAALSENEEDSLSLLFDIINEIIKERKRMFSELEVDSFEAAISITTLPLILVCLDNIVGFNGSKTGQSLLYIISDLIKEGLNYGVKFIITANHINEVPAKIRQEMFDRIALHVKDKYEYSDILNFRCNYTPPQIAGRAMIILDDRALELQIAGCYTEKDEQQKNQLIKQNIDELNTKYQNVKNVKKISALSETETWEEFASQFEGERLPLGYALKDKKAVALPYRQFSALSLYFGNSDGVSPVMKNLLTSIQKEGMEIVVIKKEKGSCFDDTCPYRIVEPTEEELLDFAKELISDLMKKKEVLVSYCEKNNLDYRRKDIYKDTYEHMHQNTQSQMIVFEDFNEVCGRVNEAAVMLYSNIFELARQYNLYFIGCFYPGNQTTAGTFYNSFNTDRLTMLFGGQFNKQNLIRLPMEYNKYDKKLQYNKCIMNYRDELHSLFVPCGDINDKEVHRDEKDIFESF